MPEQKFYLTTPIYYVNARPHIGHAYSTIAADVIARRHRLLGDDTFFLTGTDEHGQKVERSAAAAGIPPQQFADEVSASFRALWDRMGITYDDYIRTTEPRHISAVQKLFQLLLDRDKIYLSSYTGQYSIGEEMFVDGPPGTIGPDGKPTETVTEENYFFRLSEYQLPLIDLIESGPNGELAQLNIQPESSRNEVLNFVCGNLAAAAGIHDVTNQPRTKWGISQLEIDMGREKGVLKFSSTGRPYVPGALKDLSISRTSFKWGIPVPGNERHVIYVWLDALANYITAIGYGSDDPALQEKFNRYWPADLHLVGKEITRFHCVYWPAFLLAAEIATPKSVVANGWLLFDDSKMSKSKGNVVRTETILDAFGTEVYKKQFPDSTKKEQDLFAADVLRYFLLREIPFGQDGSFSFDAMITRYNADLANGYGNLVSRTLAMITNFCDAAIPNAADTPVFGDLVVDWESNTGKAVHSSSVIERYAHLAQKIVDEKLKLFQFSGDRQGTLEDSIQSWGALDSIWSLITHTDLFLTQHAPWKLASKGMETNRSQVEAILYTAAQSIRVITGLVYPFIPYATTKVWAQLGLDDIEGAARKGELKNLEWGGLKPGTKLGPLAPIFPRADKGLAQIMIDMENPNAPKPEQPTPSRFIDETTTHTAPVPTDPTHPGAPPRTSGFADVAPGTTVAGSLAISTERTGTPSHSEAPASGIFANSAAHSNIPDTPQIAIDDFVKIDLRVAQIVVAERIPKADKLLRLEVDLGYEKRQILSGIAEWYTPEELIGKKIVVIANLAPRKMRGLESHGMLLAASHGEDGKPVLATFGEEIALGSRLK
ncbi:methionine--tRNA ligase subunit beta [Tunturiibacter empetritectus]|uniref:Methionine--tRNA ligase n=1 Tax=Tunturiibacter lichenicola TaxID=2051959 RepID=A0A852VHT6_9BACT|nr:methionine--tRNA ligase subunit beta [Edaphobacter lichenicola]NYF90751.1 methionyl-tRNA synthetase [Edaphobacter lichenicola]